MLCADAYTQCVTKTKKHPNKSSGNYRKEKINNIISKTYLNIYLFFNIKKGFSTFKIMFIIDSFIEVIHNL